MTSITEDSVNPQRPKRVTTGVQFLFASLALGVIVAAISVARNTSGTAMVGALIFALMFFALSFLLVWRIAAGKNWARILWLVLVLIGTPLALRNYVAMLKVNALSSSLSIFISILQLLGTYLLITGSSNSWFRKPK
jgi:hypothetical protein